MAAVLTWFCSGISASQSAANAAGLINDYEALFNTNFSNPASYWQVAGKNVSGQTLWLVLKRKSGAAGRILMIWFGSAPAAANPTIFDTTPLANNGYIAWFPNATADTASNIDASSGVILGDDTAAVKCAPFSVISSIYVSGARCFYFETAESIFFGTINLAQSARPQYFCGAGNILVDAADNAYGGTYGPGTSGTAVNFSNTIPFPFAPTGVASGAQIGVIKTNYQSVNRSYFHAYGPGGWAHSAVTSTDVLTNTSISKAWFLPVPLIGTTKGEGFVLKLRQIAVGPATIAQFQPYNIAGPTTVARQFNAAEQGNNTTVNVGFGHPWMVNFTI
jgi:hypothetical protein